MAGAYAAQLPAKQHQVLLYNKHELAANKRSPETHVHIRAPLSLTTLHT
jgi:hypothetical protein